MKNIILVLITLLSFSCTSDPKWEGKPIIINKQYALNDRCIYTYIGYGREETFDDLCDKYSVGDTLK